MQASRRQALQRGEVLSAQDPVTKHGAGREKKSVKSGNWIQKKGPQDYGTSIQILIQIQIAAYLD